MFKICLNFAKAQFKISKSKTSKSKKQSNAECKQKRANVHSCDKKQHSSRSSSVDFLKAHQHYRLNLNDLPFCVGKSITPSHNLASNIQNVISLLKQHHPRLCNERQQHQCRAASPINTKTTPRKSLRYSDLYEENELNTRRSKSSPPVNINNKTSNISLAKFENEKKSIQNRMANKSKQAINDEGFSSNEEDEILASENIDWNELLRILQEEYTKLVL